MGRDFWKKDFWKVAMASMLGLAPAAMAGDLNIGGATGWPSAGNVTGDINVKGNPSSNAMLTAGTVTVNTGTGNVNVSGGTSVGIGENGKVWGAKYNQTGGTFTVTNAGTTNHAFLDMTGAADISNGTLAISVTGSGDKTAKAQFVGATTVGASGTISIINTSTVASSTNTSNAGIMHIGGLTVANLGKYEVVSDGAGNANAVIGTALAPAATNIQAGGTFLVHNKGTKGTGAQDMAIATHTGGLTIGGTYTIKSDGDGSANSVVSGGDLSVLAGGKLEIVNADTGGAYMAVTGTANLNGTVIIKNTGGVWPTSTSIGAGLKASVAVNIGSGADVQITTDGATAKGNAFLESTGAINMTSGKVTISDSGAGASSTYIKAGTEFKMSGGEMIVKGSSTSGGTASVQASIFNMTGGKLVVGGAIDGTNYTKSQLIATTKVDIAGGVAQIGGDAVNTIDAPAINVTGKGILQTTSSAKTNGALTVERGATVDLQGGGLNLGTANATINGDLIIGGNSSSGLNTLSNGGTVTVDNSTNIKLGATAWENYSKISVGDDLISATTLTINEGGSVIDPATWEKPYSSVLGDITVAQVGNALEVKAKTETDLGNADEVLGKLAGMGYATEKFDGGSIALISGVASTYQGATDGIRFDDNIGVADSASALNHSFYNALITGQDSFTYVTNITDENGVVTGTDTHTVQLDKKGGFIDYIFGNTDSAVAQIGMAGMTANMGATSNIFSGNSNLYAQISNQVGSDSGLASAVMNELFLNRIWAGGFGLWEDADKRNGVEGFKYHSGGFMTGYDRAFGPVIAGVNFSYTSGDFENKAASAHDSDIEIYSFNGYATYNHYSGFFGGLMGGYSYADNNIRENYGTAWTSEDFHTDSWYIGGKFGYNYSPFENLWLSPSIGLMYLDSTASSHTSWISGLGVKHVGDMEYSTAMIPIDLGVNYDIVFADCNKLTLSGNIGYAYNFDADGPTGIITQGGMNWGGVTADPAGIMEIKSRDTGHHTLNLGVGARYTFGRFDVGVKYDYSRKASYDAHRLSGTFGVSF